MKCEVCKLSILDLLFNRYAPTGELPLECTLKVGKRRWVKLLITEDQWAEYLKSKGYNEIS